MVDLENKLRLLESAIKVFKIPDYVSCKEELMICMRKKRMV